MIVCLCAQVVKLCDLGLDDSVCSVGWAYRGNQLAVGTSNGKLQLWDASRIKQIRTMEGHRLRVGALAWSSSVLSSGSRDKSILQRDIRSPVDYVSKLSGHKSEVTHYTCTFFTCIRCIITVIHCTFVAFYVFTYILLV